MGNKPNRLKKMKDKELRKMSSGNMSSDTSNMNEGMETMGKNSKNWNNPNSSINPNSSNIKKDLTPSKKGAGESQTTYIHDNKEEDFQSAAFTRKSSNWKSGNNNHAKWNKKKKNAAPVSKNRKTTKPFFETTSFFEKNKGVQIWSFNRKMAKMLLSNWKKEVEHVHLKNKPHHHKRTTPGSVDADNPLVNTGHQVFNKTMKRVHSGDKNKSKNTARKQMNRNSRKKAA